MRKLLVVSQKGGVGKTTTSMNLAAAAALSGTRVLLLDADPLSNVSTALNLAAHPRRQSLRQAGIELPGVFVANVAPGLDVYSPYEDGHCSDDDLDRLLRALDNPATHRCYGCMIVDVPPFLGGNPAQLVNSCQDFLLVMRAEALAYRTLPAFLELVQRSCRGDHSLPMRGILLTLPEGEEPGCRWERELRGRFGSRVLPQVIPHDVAIGQALGLGQIGSQAHPDSPAALQYCQLVEKLGLAKETCAALEAAQITNALREAAECLGASASPATPLPSTKASIPARNVRTEAEPPAPVPEPAKSPIPPANRLRRLGRSGESMRPSRPERALPPAPVLMKVVPAQAVPPTEPTPTPSAPHVPPPSNAHALGQLWPLWILLGAVLGGGVRFVPLTASLLPILVGLGVALLVVVVLYVMASQEKNNTPAVDAKRDRPRNREQTKPARPVNRKDEVAARLAALASAPKSRRRGTEAN